MLNFRGMFLCFFIYVFCFSFVGAIEEGYCVDFHITSISPSLIGQGEEFVVGIEIDNCGEVLPEDISFEIFRHSLDIDIKENLLVDVGKMSYSNSKRFLLYHMTSLPDASFGSHVFEVKLGYGGSGFYEEKIGNFSIEIDGEEPELIVSGVSTIPEDTGLMVDDKIFVIIDIENAGDGVAKNVRARLEGFDFSGSFNKYLGNINSHESFPVRFIFNDIEGDGLFKGNLILSYDFSGKVIEDKFPIEVYMFPHKSFKMWIFVIFALVLVLGYFFYRKNYNEKK